MSADDGKPAVAPDRQWPHTVSLRSPIDFGKETISSIVFQQGTMRAMKGMKVDEVPGVDGLLLIASRLCGRPVAALELLSPEDGAEVTEIALDFFVRSLPGSKKP